MSGHEIQHLLHAYGLGVVFAVVTLQALGAPLPGTTVLIAAAVYASTSHGVPIVGVIAAGAIGALAGTSIGFAIGRWQGERILVWAGRRLRQSPERIQRLRREFAGHGTSWLFFGRFISGVRNVTGLLAGASAMPVRHFLPVSGAAALAWAAVNSLEYYWFGQALAGAATWVQVLLVCAGLAWFVFTLRLLRRRTVRRLRDAPSPASPGSDATTAP
jgi:membrane protein DedA with SNARE-associated domain